MGFGLVIGFTEHLYTQLVTISNCSVIANSHPAIHYSTNISLLGLLGLQVSGNSFQQQRFLFLWVPELSPCLSYQLPTATGLKD
jgi:hypothetical protein